ncbi:tripartite tricarboxylate transporter substrate binding protein [Muricoccus vinaceus]|uniref:Tripartite tricarboxylate transporter substrate binding protein n=1 Tax=Muricoccus vinaceus TaxID=424704 RepID=A0ABV6INK1_9PROT
MRRRAALLLAGLGGLSAGAPALAQDYPARPVTLVVGFAPGGNADLVARLVAQQLGEMLGQTVLVENRGGAGGLLASENVARAAPDGYRLLLVSGAFPTQAATLPRLPFDPERDFTPVSMLVSYPLVVVVPSASPVQSLDGLLREARNRPRQLTYPSPGNGSLFHLAVEVFETLAGIEMTHVPFRGGSQQLNEILAGRLDVMFDTFSVVQPQLRAGTLRALAVTSAARMPQLPDVPAVAETFPGYEANSFLGVAGPAGMLPAVVGRLNAAIRQVLEQPGIRARLGELGGEPVGGTPGEMGTRISAEISRWRTVARARGIQAE